PVTVAEARCVAPRTSGSTRAPAAAALVFNMSRLFISLSQVPAQGSLRHRDALVPGQGGRRIVRGVARRYYGGDSTKRERERKRPPPGGVPPGRGPDRVGGPSGRQDWCRSDSCSDSCCAKSREMEFMQYRCPVGAGPSSKTCPRCEPQRAQLTSTRCIP